jgi:hypothetical protein
MGITYQTSNRLRRKVMTAPLVMPPEQVIEYAPTVEVPARPAMAKWWWMVAAAGATAAAMLAQKAF